MHVFISSSLLNFLYLRFIQSRAKLSIRRKIFIAIITTVILAIVGTIWWQRSQSKIVDPYALIPGDAILTFESREPVSTWNTFVGQQTWDMLSQIPYLKSLEDGLLMIDSLAGKGGRLDAALKGKMLVTSLHKVLKDEVDFLLFIEVKEESQQKVFGDILDQLKANTDFELSTRSYSGFTINEIKNNATERIYNYIIHEGFLIASYTSFLIEDVIRNIQDGGLSNFKSENPQLFGNNYLYNGLGIIKYNAARMADWLQVFTGGEQTQLQLDLAASQMYGSLELKFTEGQFLLDGFSYLKDTNDLDKKVPVLTSLQGQTSSSFNNYISNRTAIFYQYNFQELKELWKYKDLGENTIAGKFDRTLFHAKIDKQIGYSIFENVVGMSSDRVLMMEVKEVEAAYEQLKRYSMELEQVTADTAIQQAYQGFDLLQVNVNEFPAALFEGNFRGFDQTIVTKHGDFLVFANSIKAMKLYIDDFDSENTWGRSVDKSSFLAGIVKDANFNFIINLDRFWNNIQKQMSPKWKSFLQKYGSQIRMFDKLALQTSHFDDQIYTVVELGYTLGKSGPATDVIAEEAINVFADTTIVTRPFLVRSFVDRSSEYVFQDVQDMVYLLSEDGSLLWKYQLDGQMIPKVEQVDFYKNGKLQYLLTTPQSIYLIDRNGDLVEGYPISLKAGLDATRYSLLDYNKNRDYRYLVANQKGELYLYDKMGNNLEGWQPRATGYRLSTQADHYRIRTKDFILAPRLDGYIHFLNRRGEDESYSPVNVGSRLMSSYLVNIGSSETSSYLTTVSEDGQVLQVDFRGGITKKLQLPKNDTKTKFEMVLNQRRDGYIFSVQDYNNMSILKPNGELWFINPIPTSEQIAVQYFTFGGDKEVIVIIDQEQAFTYLFNQKGELMSTLPINGAEGGVYRISQW